MGERACVLALLERTTDATADRLAARLHKQGREVACSLYQLDAKPAAAVGPQSGWPKPENGFGI